MSARVVSVLGLLALAALTGCLGGPGESTQAPGVPDGNSTMGDDRAQAQRADLLDQREREASQEASPLPHRTSQGSGTDQPMTSTDKETVGPGGGSTSTTTNDDQTTDDGSGPTDTGDGSDGSDGSDDTDDGTDDTTDQVTDEVDDITDGDTDGSDAGGLLGGDDSTTEDAVDGTVGSTTDTTDSTTDDPLGIFPGP